MVSGKRYNICYYSHIPWGWIKQRPQFLAEELSKFHDVTFIYEQPFLISGILPSKDRKASNLIIKCIYRLPLDRFAIISFINNFIVWLQLKKNLASADIIWLTDPRPYVRLSKSVFNFLVYDCMDDTSEFESIKNQPSFAKRINQLERKLVEKSKIIFSSSDTLKSRILEKYSVNKSKINVVNNGIALRNFEISPRKELPSEVELHFNEAKDKQNKVFTYVGTISSWFDWDALLEILAHDERCFIFLVGPLETTLPANERIKHLGVIAHEHVGLVLERSDLLLMPFKINKLITSVNPVKMYEYILANKPIISCQYSEIEKFSDFVYFYKNISEISSLLEEIKTNNFDCKYRVDQSFEVINCWKSRVEEMLSKITIS